VTVIDPADGRCIGAAVDDTTEAFHWLACHVDREGTDLVLREHTGDIPLYGTSLAMLLAAALESGGDIDHLETGRLAQLDRAIPPDPDPPAARRPQRPPLELDPGFGLDARITLVRQAKELAIDQQDFEYAAGLLKREKDLLNPSENGPATGVLTLSAGCPRSAGS
jgi:hypothetical protein